MAFSIFPNNLGGVNTFLGSVKGPLSSLTNNSTVQNLVYPSDLSSNPAMCHAVQFSIYDYTSGFKEIVGKSAAAIAEGVENFSSINSIRSAISNFATQSPTPDEQDNFGGTGLTSRTNNSPEQQAAFITGKTARIGYDFAKDVVLPSAIALGSAPTYRPKRKGAPLANISLYMPDTLVASHNAEYGEVDLTTALGQFGTLAQGLADYRGKPTTDLKNALTTNPFSSAMIGNLFGAAAQGIPLSGVNGSVLGEVAKGALGIATNPQIQLLYRGLSLREFSLSFVFTPKSSQEAQTTKDIIDTFTYYSVPGLASAAVDGNPGQYLTPPQLFNIKFVFLGKSGIAGSIGNIFSSALNNLGLNSLTSNPTQSITGGQEAKIMNIQECVLTSVNTDYAPNGWAAYNDGFPIQTTLQLHFKETQILTKDRLKNQAVDKNYTTEKSFRASGAGQEVAGLGGSRADYMTGSNGFGNYGE
jgi:hypothetical protein